jgi:hypothetical protein
VQSELLWRAVLTGPMQEQGSRQRQTACRWRHMAPEEARGSLPGVQLSAGGSCGRLQADTGPAGGLVRCVSGIGRGARLMVTGERAGHQVRMFPLFPDLGQLVSKVGR